MKKLTLLLVLAVMGLHAQNDTIIAVEDFNKVIISPHIKVTFVEGNESNIHISQIDVDWEKMNIEETNGTLHLFLEDARIIAKSKRKRFKKTKTRQKIYEGKVVEAVITYRKLNELAVRGEQPILLSSPIDVTEFNLTAYGRSKIFFESLNTDTFNATLYGESTVDFKAGRIDYQKYLVYGESKVNAMGIENSTTKITAYGESGFKLNVSDKLKVNALGESDIVYSGNPIVDKGVVFGEASIRQIQ